MGVPLVNTFILVFLGYRILTTSKVSGLPFASIPSMPSLNLSEASTNKESSPGSVISNNDTEKMNRTSTSSGDLKLFITSPNVNIYPLPSKLSVHNIATNEDTSLSPATLNSKYITVSSASLYLPMSAGPVNSDKSSYSIPVSKPNFTLPSMDQELNINMNADNTANFRRDSRDTGPVLPQIPFLSYRFTDCDSSSPTLNSPTCTTPSRSNSNVNCISSKPLLSIINDNANTQEFDTSTDAKSDGIDTILPCPPTRSNPQISSFKKPTTITNDFSSNKSPSPGFLTLKQLNNNQEVKLLNIDNLMASSRSSCNTPSSNLLNNINVIDLDVIKSSSQNAVDESINEPQEIITSCNGPDSQNLCQNNVFSNFNARRNLGQVQLEINDEPNRCTQTDCNQRNAQAENKGYFQNFRYGCEQLTNNNAPCNENFNLGKPIQINVKNNIASLSDTNNLGSINPQDSIQNVNNNNQGCPQLRTIIGSNKMNSLAPNNIVNPANNLINQNICGNNLGCPEIIPTNSRIADNFIINNNPKFVSPPTQNQNCPQVISVPNNNKNVLLTKSIELTQDNCDDFNENRNNVDIAASNQGIPSENFVSLNDLRIQPNFGLNNNNVVSNQNNQGCSELLAIAQNNLMAMLNNKAKTEANNQNYNLGCPEVTPTAFLNNVQQSNIGICLPNNQFNNKLSILNQSNKENNQHTLSGSNNLQPCSVNFEPNCDISPVRDTSQSFITLKDVSNVIPTANTKPLFVQPIPQNNFGLSLTPNVINTLSSCNDISVPSFSLLNLNPSNSIVSADLAYLNQPTIYYPNSFNQATNLQTILSLLQSNINNNLQNNYNCNGFGNSLVSSNTIPIESLPQVSFINRRPSPTISIPISVSLPETLIPTVSNLPLVCTTPTSYTPIQPIITSSSINPFMSALLPQTNNIVGTPGLYTSLNNLVSTLTQNILSNLVSKAVPVGILPPVRTVAPMTVTGSSQIDSSMCLDVTEPLAPYFITSPQSLPRYSFSSIPVACNEYLPPVGRCQFTPLLNSDLFASASEPDVFECPFSLSDTDAFYPEVSFLASQESCLPVGPSRVSTSSAMQQSSPVSKINNTGRDAIDFQRLVDTLSQGC